MIKVLQLNHMLMKIRLLDLNSFYIVYFYNFKLQASTMTFCSFIYTCCSAKQLSVNLPSSGEFNDYIRGNILVKISILFLIVTR